MENWKNIYIYIYIYIYMKDFNSEDIINFKIPSN